MSLRTGIDVVEIRAVGHALAKLGDRYLRRVYTGAEIQAATTDAGTVDPAALAARFALKEASIKALRPKLSDAIAPNAIEALADAGGSWTIALSGRAATIAQEAGISRLSASVSTIPGYAVAVVIAGLHPTLPILAP